MNKLEIWLISILIVFSMPAALSFATDCFKQADSKDSANKAIEACTQDIDGGKYIGNHLAARYNSRGKAYRNKGLYDRAIQDYDRAIELDPNDEYLQLRSIIAAGYVSRIERDRRVDRLRLFVAENSSGKWERTISLYYIGEVTGAKMITEAARGKDTKETNERFCEAYYYAGEARLFKKERKYAANNFKKSIDTNVLSFVEYNQAKAALQMMKRKQ
jgi:lipoprotein NlpI